MKIKYPKTYHLPWSEGISSDDKIQHDLSHFENKDIIISEKMDGENTTLYSNYIHARSLDSKDHLSRHWIKGLWGNIKHEIPDNWRICGENLYAKHSIYYNNLPSYFLVFSIWNKNNICLSWKETKEWCNLLNLNTVPILYEGKFNLNFVKNFKIDISKQEGFVMRLSNEFKFEDFNKSVTKWVRESHVKTNKHWMRDKIIPNKLKNK